VGILKDGEIKTAGCGIAHYEQGREVTPDTLFQIGSITKTFTATVAMKLVEEGKLDLNVPVQTYLPDFKVTDTDASEKVTAYHLLTHSSG
jgi:CubicO group peptidase (beta-lactamase class C family)